MYHSVSVGLDIFAKLVRSEAQLRLWLMAGGTGVANKEFLMCQHYKSLHSTRYLANINCVRGAHTRICLKIVAINSKLSFPQQIQ